MLRPLLVALLLANAALLAAQFGGLDGWRGTASQREPERLARQIQPTLLQVLPPGGPATAVASAPAPAASTAPTGTSASSADAVAAAALACLQAGPFAADTLAAAEQLLQAAGVPAGAWRLLASAAPAASAAPTPTTWLIVMGRYADPQVLARKQEELRRLKVDASTLSGSASLPQGVAPGLLLGRFAERGAADAALAALAQRGVNTARVVAFQPGQAALPVLLQLPAADAELQGRLAALALPGGQVWTACPPLPAPAPAPAPDQAVPASAPR